MDVQHLRQMLNTQMPRQVRLAGACPFTASTCSVLSSAQGLCCVRNDIFMKGCGAGQSDKNAKQDQLNCAQSRIVPWS